MPGDRNTFVDGDVDLTLIPGTTASLRRIPSLPASPENLRTPSHTSSKFDLLPPRPFAGKVIDGIFTGLTKIAESRRQSLSVERAFVPKDAASSHDDSPPSNKLSFMNVSTKLKPSLDGTYSRLYRTSTRLFGGEDDCDDDHGPRSAGLWCEGKLMMLNPHNVFVRFWWWLTVILSCWNIFQAPFTVAYYEYRPPVLNGLVWAVDTFFMLDMLVNFCTPIQTRNTLITDRKQIALHYVSSLFWIHLLAAVPFDRFFVRLFPGNPYMRLVGLTRNLRFQRLILVQKKAERTISINFEIMVFTKLLISTAMLVNFEACLFWFIGIVQAPHGWMHEFGVMAATQGQPWRQHIVALYWSVTTFTTVGFGDIHPVNEAEQIYAMIVLVFNLGFGAYIVSCLLMVVSKADSAVLEFRSKVSEVAGYMKTKNIPSDLRDLAIQHLQTSEELAHHTDAPLQHCPPYIRNHILIHLYRKKLLRVPLLHGVSEDFVAAIICHNESLLSIFQPKMLVAQAGERAYNWYVIISGTVEVLDTAGNLVRTHGRSGTLGDKGIVGIPQSYNIKTTSLCRLLVVPHLALKEICQHFMADYRVLCQNLIKKLSHIHAITGFDHELQQRSVMEAKLLDQSLRMDCLAKLCRAAAMGDIPGFKALMEADPDHDIDACDYQGNRPIHVAAQAGQVDMIRHLVEEERANVNLDNGSGCSPLLTAVKHYMRDAARELRNLGAKLNLSDASATLSKLVIERNSALLELYLENGADPNSTDYNRRTPLHIACAEGLVLIADLLIAYGADTAISDRFGMTPLDEAKSYCSKAGNTHFIGVLETAAPLSRRTSSAKQRLAAIFSDGDKSETDAGMTTTRRLESYSLGREHKSALSAFHCRSLNRQCSSVD